jgi:ABC-type sugar transport system ATPase subunit
VIAVNDLALRQGSFALGGISFTVPTGKFGVLMGETGCGKTSILEMIAGLRPPASGTVLLGQTDVTHLPPAARGIGYVPQDAALFPTMTIRQHLAFALMIRRAPSKEIDARIEELSGWLGIPHLLDRRPAGLSGGEAQRVALGRALSFRPRYLLMDEPLSSLDEKMRGSLIRLLSDLREGREVTVLHVTHSRPEAEQLADVLFHLDGGQIREVT